MSSADPTEKRLSTVRPHDSMTNLCSHSVGCFTLDPLASTEELGRCLSHSSKRSINLVDHLVQHCRQVTTHCFSLFHVEASLTLMYDSTQILLHIFIFPHPGRSVLMAIPGTVDRLASSFERQDQLLHNLFASQLFMNKQLPPVTGLVFELAEP